MTGGELATVRVEVADRTARVVLSRPEVRNAIDRTVLQDLGRALRGIEQDPAIRVTIVTGEGKSFCSGFDVSSRRNEYGAAEDPMAGYFDLRDRMTQLAVVRDHALPVIAAVNGDCLGAGTVLATFADLVVVAEDAAIGLPRLPLGAGLIPPLWLHLMGPRRVKEMAFRGGVGLQGHDAVAAGWANRAVPTADVEVVAQDLANEIARSPRNLLILHKQAINQAIDLSGLGSTMRSGVLVDAFAHEVGARHALRALIEQDGLKKVIEDYEAGRLDL